MTIMLLPCHFLLHFYHPYFPFVITNLQICVLKRNVSSLAYARQIIRFLSNCTECCFNVHLTSITFKNPTSCEY